MINNMLDQLNMAIQDVEQFGLKPVHLIVGVKLPSGAIEVIHNTQDIPGKLQYYKNHYEDVNGKLCLSHNHAITIEGIMVL